MNERLKRLAASRHLITTRLYLSIGGAVLLTVSASLVGCLSFDSIREAQNHVSENSIPELGAAFAVAQHSATLIESGPHLTATTNPQELALITEAIGEARDALEQGLSDLLDSRASRARAARAGDGQSFDVVLDLFGDDATTQRELEALVDEAERSQHIRTLAESLLSNIKEIDNEMSDIFQKNDQAETFRIELASLKTRLDDIMEPTVDDQLFYTMTGYRSMARPPASPEEHFSVEQFDEYRNLAGLHAEATTATQLLESAFSIPSAPLIEPLRERFESAAGAIERNLGALSDSSLHSQIQPVIARLLDIGAGSGSDNVFEALESRLQLVEHQQLLLQTNRGIAVDLVSEVVALVNSTRASAEAATQSSEQAILTGRTLLLSISASGVAGAVLISWLFVGRVLLRRIKLLTSSMRQMAAGDIKTKVDLGGKDEVAVMAEALEVFRHQALEAQRLNLVERLAEELQSKNDELEVALKDLRRVQDQIILREKLAALGELTAGVAHEIRNPLNFVKNFSEVTIELIVELRETLAEEGVTMTEEQQSLLEEITGDINVNLGRIAHHGNRADRIVHDMLMIGRDVGEYQETDVNALVDEHTRLAYHSARAQDNEFQLDIREDMHPNTGVIVAISRDIGRLILNIVGNACDATDEKRRAMRKAGKGDAYMPTLNLATRRVGENVEISIKDNGDGIPQEFVDSIFNPFFTTKPTDRGTGLGLAISNDIARQHGGMIEVDTQPGQYTEMLVTLPVKPDPAALAAAKKEAESED